MSRHSRRLKRTGNPAAGLELAASNRRRRLKCESLEPRLMLSGDAGWAVSFGDAGWDSVWGGAVAADGGCYVVGDSESTNGGFLRKYDASGNTLWTVAATQGTTSGAYGVDEGDQGLVYGLMKFTDSVTIGGQQFTSRGGGDALLVTVDADQGIVQNVTQLGGPADEMAVSVDYEAGNLFVTGAQNGGLWIARLGADGSEVWSRSFGSVDTAIALGFAVDATSDGVYVTGRFGEQTISFDGIELTPRGGYDVFVARLASADGTTIWANRFGGDGDTVNEHGGSLVVDELNDRLYVAGVYNTIAQSTADFGGFDLVSVDDDIFVMQMDNIATSNPTVAWASRIGGDGQDTMMLSSLAIDISAPGSPIYLTGTFGALEQSTDFDPDPVAERILTPTGFRDAFIAALDRDGNYVSASPLSSLTNSGGKWIGIAPDGMIYTAGEFDGRMTTPAGQTLEAAGARTADQAYGDGYLVKLNPDLGHIRGHVFADSPGLSQNEPGLAGWTVRADNGQTQVTTQTDLWGNYSLPVVPGQTYQVELIPNSSWQQAIPAGDQGYSVTYGSDPSMYATGYDFGATTATLTRTQFQTNPGTRIKDGQTVSSSLTVSDSFDLLDVNVTVDIQHPDVGNLKITLISPDGDLYPLTCFDGAWMGGYACVCGVRSNYTNTTFNEEAEQTLEEGAAPYTGEFQPLPVAPLAELRGTNVQGEWTLEVRDTSWTRNSPGKLNSWSVDTTSWSAPANNPPVASNDTANTDEDTPVDIDVLANDSDPEDDPIHVSSAKSGAHGTVVNNGDGTVTYTPEADFTGSDTFTYTITDDYGGTDVATVSVTVAPVNDAPVANDDSATTPQDAAVVIPVLANDTDVDLDTLSIDSVGAASNGTVTVGGSTVTYTPDAGYVGGDSFTYTVSDGNGGTDNATVNVEVTRTNDAPVAVDDNYSTSEDVELTIAAPGVLGNDTDGDADPLTAVLVTGPADGTLTLNPDGSFTYDPDLNFNGTDSFTYKADDDIDQSNVATVNLTITPVNDAPVAVDDLATTDQDMEETIDVLANDTDVDSATLSVTGASDPPNGTVVVNADNTITYTPDPGFHDVDTFTYTVSDGSESDIGTVSVDVAEAGPAMYIYDIRFESRKGGRDWQALVEVRDDLHRPIAGATVTVDFYGETYTGPTDATGIFRTGWAVKVTRGTHYADVVNLVMGTYTWDHDLDVEEDDDGDGYIDDFFTK